MLVKKNENIIEIYAVAADGFNREDSKLIQLVSRLSRKFPGKTESKFNSDAKYTTGMSCVMKIDTVDANAVANIIRLSGIRADVE